MDSCEDLVLALMHAPSLVGVVVVVPDQVQETVHDEQIHFEREGDTHPRGLTRRRVGRDDHLPEQSRHGTFQIEGEHVGRSSRAEVAFVKPPDLAVIDHRDMEIPMPLP